MAIAEEYRRQFQWRDWDGAFAQLPPLAGKTLLDLGCGIGQLAYELAERGATVVAFDGNEELLHAARPHPRVELRRADLAALPPLDRPADGIWCSFVAAYFVDLPTQLRRWRELLAPGGFLAVIEIDDLFAHEPVAATTRATLERYVDEALAARRYDFRMGRKLEAHLGAAGFTLERSFVLPDREFSAHGPLAADVIAAWRARLARMQLLQQCAGAGFPALRDDFLAALARSDHRSGATVRGCVARAAAPPR